MTRSSWFDEPDESAPVRLPAPAPRDEQGWVARGWMHVPTRDDLVTAIAQCHEDLERFPYNHNLRASLAEYLACLDVLNGGVYAAETHYAALMAEYDAARRAGRL